MEDNLFVFMVVGFFAQIIDGALGMAYGVSSTTFLLNVGVTPAVASASVHISEVFTTLASGLSHLKFGNVDKQLFRSLVLPGMVGGISGAYILSELPGDTIKPFISLYLAVMGARILWKALKNSQMSGPIRTATLPLGLIGGFFDAIGGGGWGPIVTTTLVVNGHSPRHAIGSVNLAEFFVTFSESLVFLLTVKLTHWQIIVGLLLGGVVAAPFAALVCRRLAPRTLMIIVGLLIIALSIRTIVLSL
jgi:uncharacterized protein